MGSRCAVIILCKSSARDVVRTADAVARQTRALDEVFVAAGHLPAGVEAVVASTAARLGHRPPVVDGSLATAVNGAVARSSSEFLALVPAGALLSATVVESWLESLSADAAAVGLVPPARIQSPDGLRVVPLPSALMEFEDLLVNPSAASPVLVLRRSAWTATGGLDETLEPLAWLDLCLRVCRHGRVPMVGPDVAFEADFALNQQPLDDPRYLEALRTVFGRHLDAIQPVTASVLLRRHTAAATLIAHHRTLVASRDEGLAELEALNHQIAEGGAWLTANRRDTVDWGDFRRTDPISRDWGYDRGVPVDRYYIEAFLSAHASDVCGVILEVQEDDFTRRFGNGRVSAAHVVDLDESNPRATVVADLRHAPHLTTDRYDCIILTQTLHVIDDMPAVLRECFRLLTPGGVLLATFPAASRVCLEYGERGDMWRLTPAGAGHLVESVFGVGSIQTASYGNVQTNLAFLHGLSVAELTDAEFDACDPYYPALTGVRARKGTPARRRPRTAARGVVLLYHRVSDDQDVHALNVTPAHFKSQLAWLSANCTVMPLAALLSMREGDLPEAAVAVSFDDGYLDNLEVAAPMLQTAGVPAAFFLTTRWLHEPGEYWWDLLERAILRNPNEASTCSLELDGQTLSFPLHTMEERASAHSRIHDALVRSSLQARDRAMVGLSSLAGRAVTARRPMLADEVRGLASLPGVAIGAHSVNHLALSFQGDDTIRSEVEECRAELSRVVGARVDDFAYPFGAVDRRVATLIRPDCRWAIECGDRALEGSFDTMRVPRLEVKDWDVATLASRVGRALTDGAVAAGRAR